MSRAGWYRLRDLLILAAGLLFIGGCTYHLLRSLLP